MTIDELKFQSPPPMREATTIPLKMMPASLHFNPRLPCGRRRSSISMPGASRQFQSSPPMREATQDLLRRALTIKHFNPRLPCGRRRTIATTARTIFYFNPHLPCGRQLGSVSPVAKSSSFQSPPPMRGATVFGRGAAPGSYISTHAPHAESDTATITARATKAHFNPHLPCGRRRGKKYFSSPSVVFQSPPPMREATREPFGWRYGSEFQPTLPMRGATCCSDPCDQAASISTHAPHAGSDEMCARIPKLCLITPPPPQGGSDVSPTPTPQPTTISTHAPHAGSDADNVYNAISAGQFQPTLPMRGATNYKPHYWRFCRFQPTLPMRGATRSLTKRSASTIFQPTLPMRGATR